MQAQTYKHKQNARRAARAAGLDPDQAVQPNVDGTGFIVQKPATDGFPDMPEELMRDPPTAEQTADLMAKAQRTHGPDKEIVMRKTSSRKSSSARKPIAKGGDKTDLVVSMLKDKKGATVEQMVKATSWQPHTLRARICILKKPPHGLKIERDRKDGVTSYRLVA